MQKLTYYTIDSPSQYEIPKIKGSRFLTYLYPCEEKTDAENFLEKIRKEHFNATHHCSSRRLWINVHYDLFENVVIEPKISKSNDDWEPTNTAWKPILNVLEWENLLNICAIVVRYFWWTLLWVWWLIQAYTQATKEAILHSNIVEKEILKQFKITHDYNQTSLVAHLIEKYNVKLISETCNDKTIKILTINQWLINDFDNELKENSNWSLKINN